MASTGGSDGAFKSEPSSSSSRSSSSFTSRDSSSTMGSRVSMEPTSLTIGVLQEITDNFSDERALGQGGYGKVYKGVYVNGEVIAVKLLHNNMQAIDDKQFELEFDNLMMLNHPNIVRLVGYCYETQRQHMDFQGRIVFGEKTYKALCFEYMHMGSLRRHLSDEFSGLDWQTRYKIIRATCEGLKYLHKGLNQPIYHLDLKPDNILLDENMVAKLADFGLSKLFDEEQTMVTQSALGTIGYMPPEYLFGHVVSSKLDIFSLGVVMTQIIAGPKGHTRCAEMAYQEFLDQVHENWSNRLEKTCTSSLVLEAYCQQVDICTEIGVRCMEHDRRKRPSIVDIVHRLDQTEAMIEKVTDSLGKKAKQYASSEPRPTTPIKPGSVQLMMKNSTVAPLLEHKQKVMLELTGGDYTIDRPGLDLVAVVDVSKGMQGEKIDQVKTALRFLVRKLTPMDRLSIITFDCTVKQLLPLRQVTETSQRELEDIISKVEPRDDLTHITEGLQDGLVVLAERQVHIGRVAGIILVSCSNHRYGLSTSVDVSNVPVYIFCFGGPNKNDPMVLARVAAKSMGGTFSHVMEQDTGGLTMAFSQCLAGLLTVAVQNLELTVAAVNGESKIVKVTAGSYPQEQDKEDSPTIRFGNLYSMEVRKVIVEPLLPATQSERSTAILDVTYSHNCSAGRLKSVAPTETLTVWRTGVQFSPDEEKPEGLLTEEARQKMPLMIKLARNMADCNRLDESKDMLLQAHNRSEEHSKSLVGRTELQELFHLFKTQETYKNQGRQYALSCESSHSRQRLTTRGADIDVMRLFTTPRMDKYLEQAKKFLNEPTMLLLSVDDDIKEKVGALTDNVASREEEMHRLSMDVVFVRKKPSPTECSKSYTS